MDIIHRFFSDRETRRDGETMAVRGIVNDTSYGSPNDDANPASASLDVIHMIELACKLREEDRELLLVAAQRMARS